MDLFLFLWIQWVCHFDSAPEFIYSLCAYLSFLVSIMKYYCKHLPYSDLTAIRWCWTVINERKRKDQIYNMALSLNFGFVSILSFFPFVLILPIPFLMAVLLGGSAIVNGLRDRSKWALVSELINLKWNTFPASWSSFSARNPQWSE